MRYSFLILMAIYVIYHVVSGLLQEKKQKQEEPEAQHGRRRAAQGGRSGAQVQAGPAAAPRLRPGPTAIREARIDDLSARRRSQLDQLRARRESRRTIQPAELRVGGPAAGPPTTRDRFPPGLAPTTRTRFPPGLAPTTRTIPPVQPGREELRAAQRQERRQRVERAPAAAKRPEAKPPILDIEPSRRRLKEEVVDAFAIGGPRRRGRGGRVGRLLSQLDNPASLRDLFLLKEVLDPPVALRGPGTP